MPDVPPEDPKMKVSGKKHKDDKGMKGLPPLLQTGELLRNRYAVEAMIGGGGFGQIFRATDRTKDDLVAIKIEPSRTDPRRMKLEQMVLVLLRGRSHIPTILSSGKVRDCPFIVMQMLGKNLSELRRREKGRRLSHGTVYRVAEQVVTGLRHMHENGYLHRDVKPSNCCIGRSGPDVRLVYIVDFGMARQYRDINGNVRRARDYAGFRGTVRYVSPTIHARKEPGPADDLVGWLYSMVELADGSLPWTNIRDPKDVEKSKLTVKPEGLCKNQPRAVLEFVNHVTTLQYDQTPDYELIMTVFRKCLPSDVSETSPYDWEKERETKKAAGGVDETQERDLGKTSTMAHGEKREPLSAARAETSRNTLKDAKKTAEVNVSKIGSVLETQSTVN
ncbi:Protein kinase domain containing protein [Aphelenchoides avenae]|nr:Protein kinase domain containing protein [Aphelenchus avenae]